MVSSAGALVRSSGATSATRPATAQYQVVFNRVVSSCAFVAAIDPPSAAAPNNAQGVAHSVGTTGNTSAVSVFTYQTNGNAANRPFTLAVFC